MKYSFILPALAALDFSACAQYASISHRHPSFTPQTSVGTLAEAQQRMEKAQRTAHKDPLGSLGSYLTAAEEASLALARTPGNEPARKIYNFAVSRIFTTIQEGHLDPWSGPLRVPAPGGDFILEYRKDPDPEQNPALCDITPADEFIVKGTYVKEQSIKEGLGAPLVAVGKQPRSDARERFVNERLSYGTTALIRFGPGRRCEIEFTDPLRVEDVTFAGRSFPVAANFTVPIAVMLAKENPKKLEFARAFRPASYAETARVTRLQPYEPDKTVVLFIHGLIDSPATWTPMINALRGDPYIRQHYQFWFFSYPSGYPYPYSAALLRKELDAIEAKYPLKHKMVLVGHSMGSLISRLMATDSGETLWDYHFGKPPGQTRLSSKTKALLEDALIFRHRPEVDRMIFICGPHRGSDIAANWIGRLGSSLVKMPVTILNVGPEILKLVKADTSSLELKRIPNSVDTLAPNNRFVRAINTIPITPGIPYYSIIGDRGKGGHKDRTPPVSSDGAVPYWSSHLEGAQSELVVPSNHSAHQNAQAIAEVGRILKLNAAR